jgi:hypothetical protein
MLDSNSWISIISSGYCWIAQSGLQSKLVDWIVIDNPKSKLDFEFGLSIQIQNFIIILSKNQNFIVHHAPTMKPSYFLSKFSNN